MDVGKSCCQFVGVKAAPLVSDHEFEFQLFILITVKVDSLCSATDWMQHLL